MPIPDTGAVTRSLQFRAGSETHPTHSYDQSVMIEWSCRHPILFGEMHNNSSFLGLAVRARFVSGLAVLVLTGAPARANAQQPTAASIAPTGRIVGRILDATTGQGLADVGVQIVGTTLGTMSAVDGR